MPNWCENRLIIQGDKRELKSFLELVKGPEKQFAPCLTPSSLWPVEKNEVGEEEFWKLANWEVRKQVIMDSGEYKTEIIFDTAWAPPKPWILHISNIFPNLDFDLRFVERSMGFAGKYQVNDSVVLLEEHKESVDKEFDVYILSLGYVLQESV
jgi:hypothetical protein